MYPKEKNTIPMGWALAKLSDVAHFINGKAFKSQDWRNKGIPIIRIQNLNNLNSTYNCISESQHVAQVSPAPFDLSTTVGCR